MMADSRVEVEEHETTDRDGDWRFSLMGCLIILSGPSCVSKGSLHTAFSKFYPEYAQRNRRSLCYLSVSFRDLENSMVKIYYCRSREEIEGTSGKRKISLCRMFAETYRQLI
jgi:hypothetical protein